MAVSVYDDTMNSTQLSSSSIITSEATNDPWKTTTLRSGSGQDEWNYYKFDGNSVVIIMCFIIIQISIWTFFIFCYFTRKGTSQFRTSIHPIHSLDSKVPDLPPEYEIAVNPVDYPPFVEINIEDKPPEYNKVTTSSRST